MNGFVIFQLVLVVVNLTLSIVNDSMLQLMVAGVCCAAAAFCWNCTKKEK